MKPDTTGLEAAAYRSRYDDGIIDLAIGLALVWIGIAWLWIPSLAGVSGVIPAVLVPAVGPVRRRFLEPRVGYVRWSPPRVHWEGLQLRRLLVMGVAALILGLGVFWWASQSDGNLQPVVGLPALLLAMPTVLLGAATRIRRLWWYGGLLIAAAVITIAVEAGPGAPLLTAGAVIALCGLALLIRFVVRHPVRAA